MQTGCWCRRQRQRGRRSSVSPATRVPVASGDYLHGRASRRPPCSLVSPAHWWLRSACRWMQSYAVNGMLSTCDAPDAVEEAADEATMNADATGGSAAIEAPAHVTMLDIARASGVSQSTVSRVLNATPSSIPISAQTREQVFGAARRLGYRPNPLARGLRGARTMLLGVIVRDIVDPFFSGAIE